MGQLHFGVHPTLDDAATELIRQSLEGVTSMAEKSDILTPWKEVDRRRREVYAESGVPDGALRRGMYHRAWNRAKPHLNSREGKVPVPGDRAAGVTPNFGYGRGIEIGEVYDLRISWCGQVRIKCPFCAKYMSAADLDVTCRFCGSKFSKAPAEGHYQVVRIRHGH
jgi:hypothetical protein